MKKNKFDSLFLRLCVSVSACLCVCVCVLSPRSSGRGCSRERERGAQPIVFKNSFNKNCLFFLFKASILSRKLSCTGAARVNQLKLLQHYALERVGCLKGRNNIAVVTQRRPIKYRLKHLFGEADKGSGQSNIETVLGVD